MILKLEPHLQLQTKRIMKKRFKYLFFIGGLMLLTLSFLPEKLFEKESDELEYPPNGYVPDKVTAIKIAEAIWLPIFGERIYKNKPFQARLIDSTIWVVEGTLPYGFKGGTPYIEIQRNNSKVLQVTHGK